MILNLQRPIFPVAKYSSTLSSASPDVLLVEEAGEILESHILTALGQRAKQLVLIGDHKQLRPKVNNYTLTVERGDGYDLNRSLFERLVLRGYPHTVLNKQHRMRPEISSLIRHLMYPDLIDADSTENRGNVRGFRDNLIFINHDKPEDEMPKVAELRDLGSKSSKQNTHEVNMILKIVRYLGQQGYGTDKLVILTPYLGQLYKFMDALKNENDPILNDLDSFDLVRAGLLPASVAKLQKKRIRIATIDNYQGEESDIVIVSLTRSNSSNDIGFMSSPQRLNVLLSRARDALIMIGNAQTFINSRKGGDIWTKLFELLKRNGHMYEGLPVECERHKDRITLLKMPSDFDLETPDGGCKEPCQSLLSCGLHTCPSKCHQLYDHSKMECKHIVKNSCPNGHNQDYACYEGLPASCEKCESEAKIAEDKRREALELRRRRDAEEQEHLRQIAEIEAEIALERQKVADARLEEQRKNSIAQKNQDLKDVRSRVTDVCKTLFNNTISSLVGTSTEQTTATANTTQQGLTSERISAGHISPPAKVATSSPSQVEWSRQKEVDGASNDHLDQIMEMIGLEAVKAKVLDIKDRVEVSKRQNVPLTSERFNAVFLGNPGTGKTTVARHFAKFLSSVEVIPTDTFVETSGSRLASDGILGAKKMIEDILKAGGGAIFVDEAYQLTSGSNYGGGQVLDFLLAEMENNVGKIVFILAGYSEPMEKFFEHNVGLTSRVPHQLVFSDYSDEELLNMLENKVSKKWKGEMQVDDGMRGLYSRIAIRRLGRGRGKEGFGNARALENLLSSICDRQARRLRKQRRDGQTPSDFLIVKEDLIGPDPSDAILGSAAWEKLNKMIGLKAVKSSIQAMFQMIKENYHRELHEKEPMLVSLNRVFLGNPGTGKTTVAKLYGQILVDIGLLSNGEVIIKNPADFVGSVLGESEQKTKAILANTVGKVLVIDEAYMLYGGSSNGSNNNDIYKTAVIDTIVAEVQGVPGDDRCVLMLGYEPQMRDMFQSVNPGLSRRFAIEDAFRFEDYSDSELMEILDLKLKQQDLHATDATKVTAIRMLSMARNRPNFGNGGEVENMLTKAKGLYQSRIAHLPPAQRSVDVTFEPQDFDPQFDRVNRSSENLDKLFQDVIGCDKIKEKLKDYQKIASSMTLERAKELIPTNFIFKGPPGTGKTTTARKMGDVYYDMGFLSSSEVMECSASDLVGQFVGHTGPKTKKIFEKALGRVLFIDEAYRLGEGQFAKEAIDEVVGILTSETFASKLIVILAGYDEDMNKLLAVNSGLSSRFPEEFIFENMSPAHSLAILKGELKRHDVYVHSLDDPNSTDGAEVLRLLKELSNLPSWGNARDIKTLGKTMIRTAAVKDRQPKQEDGEDFRIELKAEDALACLLLMLKDRKARSIDMRTFSDTAPSIQNLMQQLSTSPPPPTPAVVIGHNTGTRASSDNRDSEIKSPAVDGEMSRDAGVSDETWNELRRDKLLAAEDAKRRDEELQRLQSELIEKQNIEDAKKAEAHELELAKQRAKDFAAIEELKRKQEEIRLREVQAALERQRIEEELEEKRKREAERRAAEVKVQQKLRTMGVCPAGFNWTKQANGYRCAGGSHFVTNVQLGL